MAQITHFKQQRTERTKTITILTKWYDEIVRTNMNQVMTLCESQSADIGYIGIKNQHHSILSKYTGVQSLPAHENQ